MEYVFVALLILAVVIVLNYLIAKEFSRIAAEKGYPQKKYFWWCFLMGAIGLCMVIALPDRGKATFGTDADELPEL